MVAKYWLSEVEQQDVPFSESSMRTLVPFCSRMATAAPAQSSLQASVADEAEELQAEAGLSSSLPLGPTDPADGEVKNENGDGVDEEEEAEEDPDRLPNDACETLYLQNLNEKVRVEGGSSAFRSS